MSNKVILVDKNLLSGSVNRHYSTDLDSFKVSDLFTMSFVAFTVLCSRGVAVSSAVVVPT